MHIRVFGQSDVGRRRALNEDNLLIADLTNRVVNARGWYEIGPRGVLLSVCDGMGGSAAGEVASAMAVDNIYQQMLTVTPGEDQEQVGGAIDRAVRVANQQIFQNGNRTPGRRGMGTTCTLALILNSGMFFGQVGDSRAYVLRGGRLVQVTKDQSLVNKLIEDGHITEEEARTHEHRNVILQALGTENKVTVDLTFVPIRKGDILLLCSDGLTNMVRDDVIHYVLSSASEPFHACEALVQLANEAGGADNITVIVATFDDGETPTPQDIQDLRYQRNT